MVKLAFHDADTDTDRREDVGVGVRFGVGRRRGMRALRHDKTLRQNS